jgi:predicted RNA-binding Zn ribbon-like protein
MPSTPPGATDPPAPLHVGDHAALDFLNSVFTPQDEAVDLLADGASLRTWLAASGVVPVALAEAAAVFTPQQLQRAATEARELREWFRDLLPRWQAGGAKGVRSADLARLNELLAKGRLQQSVARGPDGVLLQTTRQVDSPADVLAELAAACAALLASHRAEQVRRCENPACTLWFADTKRGPPRRWCSMAVCGNRMKVAAHRARRRGET